MDIKNASMKERVYWGFLILLFIIMEASGFLVRYSKVPGQEYWPQYLSQGVYLTGGNFNAPYALSFTLAQVTEHFGYYEVQDQYVYACTEYDTQEEIPLPVDADDSEGTFMVTQLPNGKYAVTGLPYEDSGLYSTEFYHGSVYIPADAFVALKDDGSGLDMKVFYQDLAEGGSLLEEETGSLYAFSRITLYCTDADEDGNITLLDVGGFSDAEGEAPLTGALESVPVSERLLIALWKHARTINVGTAFILMIAIVGMFIVYFAKAKKKEEW